MAIIFLNLSFKRILKRIYHINSSTLRYIEPFVGCPNYFFGFVAGGGNTAVLTIVGASLICPLRIDVAGLSCGFGFSAILLNFIIYNLLYFFGFVEGGGATDVLSIKGLSLICPSLNVLLLAWFSCGF